MNVNFPALKKIVNESFVPLFYNHDRYLLLWGGRGSSKSNFAAKKLIFDCLNEPYFRYILIRKTYATIKDSQFQTIKDIVYDWGLQSLFRFKENPLEIHCTNGNIFYARGCDDVSKIKSIKDPSGAWWEETNEVSLSDFITVTTSIRTSKPRFLQEILTFNPETEEEPEEFWINKMFFNGKSNDKCFKSVIEIPVGDSVLRTAYTSHHSTYHDNRWASPQFIAFLEQLLIIDPYFYDVFCKGIWGTKKGDRPFAHLYNPAKHEATDAEIQNGIAIFNPSRQIMIRVDFNLQPFAVTFSHYWKDQWGEHWHIFDEGEIKHGSVQAMIEMIKLKYGSWLHAAMLTGDAMGKRGELGQPDNASLYKQLLRGLGMKESQLKVPANPTHRNSRNDVNYVLYHFPDYKINPKKCPNLCRDMKSVQVDAFGEILKKNRKDLNQRADYIDTERYGINTFLRGWIDQHQKYKK